MKVNDGASAAAGRPLAFVRHHSIAAFVSLIPQLNFFPHFAACRHVLIYFNMNFTPGVSLRSIQIKIKLSCLWNVANH